MQVVFHMLMGIPWNPAAPVHIGLHLVFCRALESMGVRMAAQPDLSCLFLGVQGTAAYNAVQEFHDMLPDIRRKGITLCKGLPVDELDKILGVDAEGIPPGTCLATLVEVLRTQAQNTIPQGKASQLASMQGKTKSVRNDIEQKFAWKCEEYFTYTSWGALLTHIPAHANHHVYAKGFFPEALLWYLATRHSQLPVTSPEMCSETLDRG